MFNNIHITNRVFICQAPFTDVHHLIRFQWAKTQKMERDSDVLGRYKNISNKLKK